MVSCRPSTFFWTNAKVFQLASLVYLASFRLYPFYNWNVIYLKHKSTNHYFRKNDVFRHPWINPTWKCRKVSYIAWVEGQSFTLLSPFSYQLLCFWQVMERHWWGRGARIRGRSGEEKSGKSQERNKSSLSLKMAAHLVGPVASGIALTLLWQGSLLSLHDLQPCSGSDFFQWLVSTTLPFVFCPLLSSVTFLNEFVICLFN